MADRYTIDREIGRGGAARVFRATTPDGRAVALKILHPELVVSVTADRFLREVRLLAAMDHPRIARMLDYGEAEFLVYYVMDLVDGPSLRDHLLRARRATISDTLHIARDLLDALGYAHGRGVVHRDVKPENIALARDGAVLMDFGVARAIVTSGTERLTRSGFTVGTSAYMSPEQVARHLLSRLRTLRVPRGTPAFHPSAGGVGLADATPDTRSRRPHSSPGYAPGTRQHHRARGRQTPTRSLAVGRRHGRRPGICGRCYASLHGVINSAFTEPGREMAWKKPSRYSRVSLEYLGSSAGKLS